MANVKQASLRESVFESIGNFLYAEKFNPGDEITQTGILEIINLLSDYQEEGISLFPEILITNNLDFFKTICNEQIVIHEADLSIKEFKKAIKLCAPLAANGWIIFIEVKEGKIKYGITTAEIAETSVSIYHQTVGRVKLEELPGITVAYIRNIGQNTVELTGLKTTFIVSLTLNEVTHVSSSEIDDLCHAITKDCADTYKNNIKEYFDKIISEGLKIGHGNLIAVVEDNNEAIEALKAKISANGGIYLPIPLDFEQMITDLENSQSLDANNNLRNKSQLLKSMLNHDGITVLSSKGKVIGYHILIADYINEGDVIDGGARSKAFKSMENCGLFFCCFFKSQDGNAKIWKRQ